MTTTDISYIWIVCRIFDKVDPMKKAYPSPSPSPAHSLPLMGKGRNSLRMGTFPIYSDCDVCNLMGGTLFWVIPALGNALGGFLTLRN